MYPHHRGRRLSGTGRGRGPRRSRRPTEPLARNGKLLIFGMSGLASRTLIWLAAALLPFQPLSVMSCRCDTNCQPSAGAKIPHGQNRVESGCCSSQRQSGSCCAKTQRPGAETCCGDGCMCSCSPNKVPPPVPQVPSETRSRSIGGLTQAEVGLSLGINEFHASQSAFSDTRPSGCSGAERCIGLCRFNL
jgi:hypothetical protein